MTQMLRVSQLFYRRRFLVLPLRHLLFILILLQAQPDTIPSSRSRNFPKPVHSLGRPSKKPVTSLFFYQRRGGVSPTPHRPNKKISLFQFPIFFSKEKGNFLEVWFSLFGKKKYYFQFLAATAALYRTMSVRRSVRRSVTNEFQS